MVNESTVNDSINGSSIAEGGEEEERSAGATWQWRRQARIILAWQGVALLLTGTAVFSQLLANHSVSLPTTQSFLNYLVLGVWFGSTVIRRGEGPRERWWKYFIIAAADVEGNFLLVMAYQYTTIISVQLLDCFTIPVVMVLSWRLLGANYGRCHLAGAVISLAGLGLLVSADALFGRNSGGEEPAKNPILGDILVMVGSTLYGISNIGQEYMVKERDRVEFLAHLGVFGAIISGIQMGIIERFGGCLLGMYVLVPILLEISSATFMNLSLLTADFYSLLFALVLFTARPTILYFIAFGVIISGIVIFNVAGDATGRGRQRHTVLKSESEEEMSQNIVDLKEQQ